MNVEDFTLTIWGKSLDLQLSYYNEKSDTLPREFLDSSKLIYEVDKILKRNDIKLPQASGCRESKN